jgi:hypothetical protein
MSVLFHAIVFLQLLLPAATSAPAFPYYGPAFTLDVAPTRPLMRQGGSAQLTVFIRNADPSSYQLSIAGVPASVTAEVPPLQPGANTIVLRCAPNTPNATYALQVTVAGAQNQQTQTFPLDIKPLLLAP